MKSTGVLRLAVFAATVLTAAPAPAASVSSIYDMDRMLSEPHPLASQYGTRWRPAPVQAVPRPAAPAMSPNLGVDSGNGKIAPYTPPQMPKLTPRPLPFAAPVAAPVAAPARPQTQTRTRPAAAPAKKRQPFISEIKLGALGHDLGPFSSNKEDGVDAQVEIRFASPGFLKAIWSPNPHIGADISTSGNTSSVWIGVVWERPVWKKLFVGWSMGGAYHDGATDKGTGKLDEKELGCSTLFRLGLNVGWQFSERHSIDVLLDHISNAKICDTNEGLENVGIRYGYKF